MEKNIAQEQIEHLLVDARKTESQLSEALLAAVEKRTDDFVALASDAALRSEVFASRMRHLLYSCTDTKKPEYLIKAAEMQGMAVREYAGIFEIELPCLFPKRKKQGSSYLTDPLYFLLDRYTSTHRIRRLENAVICYIHTYDRHRSSQKIRDYDNLELKQVQDVIAAFMLVDDSGICCDTYHTTEVGDKENTRVSTRVLVMPKSHFSVWLGENGVR